MALLEVNDLTVSLQSEHGATPLVENVTFSIDRGQTLCIVGESGSGKTVTAQSIIRLMEYVAPVQTTGQISFDGTEITNADARQMAALRGMRIGMIFQECMEALNPTKRVGVQLREVWDYHHGAREAGLGSDARERALQMLREVEMPDPEGCLDKYPHQLSGGMQQRAMIAMALMCEPDLLIADEPTTALDVTIQAEILRRLRLLQTDRGMASLLITHDMGIAAELADVVGVMYAGRMVEMGSVSQLLRSPRHPYTAGLLACVPRPGQRASGPLPTIPGNVPAPGERPVGCRFAARCARATDQCRGAEPPLKVLQEGGHPVACWHPLSDADAAAVRPVATAPEAVARARSEEALIALDDVSKIYAKGARATFGARSREALESRDDAVIAVDHVSLALHAGELYGLVGETGSGKSTLGRMIAKLEPPTGGTVSVGGTDLGSMRGRAREKAFRRQVQIVFQDPYASIDPRYTVERVIAEPLRALTEQSRTQSRERVRALLAQVGLTEQIATKRIDELSGGQRQRVAIARAMAVEPQVIVADEPTSALDVSVQGQVMNVLLSLQREFGLTYLFISHNLNLVLSVADRVGVMYLGALVEEAPAIELGRAPAHPYTAALLAANPDPDSPRDEFASGDADIGETESPMTPGGRGGCRFRHRCPRAAERCSEQSPPLQMIGAGRRVACHFPLIAEPAPSRSQADADADPDGQGPAALSTQTVTPDPPPPSRQIDTPRSPR